MFVSNGYMTPALLERMAGLIDGINVDLKAGRGEFYHKVSGANLAAVLANLKLIRRLGIWLEVTTLVIPGFNDGDEELRWVAGYLHDELGPDVPWHVSRFYPGYKMDDVLPTPAATLERAWEAGRDAGLSLRLRRQLARPPDREHLLPALRLTGHRPDRLPGAAQVVARRRLRGLRHPHRRGGHGVIVRHLPPCPLPQDCEQGGGVWRPSPRRRLGVAGEGSLSEHSYPLLQGALAMLTLVEKVLFVVAVAVSLYLGYTGFRRVYLVIRRGQPEAGEGNLVRRALEALWKWIALAPTWRVRMGPNVFHAMVAWGFMFYFLVNFGDVLAGYFPITFLGTGAIGNVYRFLADVFSVPVLVGMVYFLVRRFVYHSPALTFHDNVRLLPKVAAGGMRRDSLIVGGFILFHVGFRFLGESFALAAPGTRRA